MRAGVKWIKSVWFRTKQHLLLCVTKKSKGSPHLGPGLMSPGPAPLLISAFTTSSSLRVRIVFAKRHLSSRAAQLGKGCQHAARGRAASLVAAPGRCQHAARERAASLVAAQGRCQPRGRKFPWTGRLAMARRGGRGGKVEVTERRETLYRGAGKRKRERNNM